MSLTKVSFSMISGAPINVLDYGADPSGTVSSTIAIQAAIDAAGALGGAIVYVPIGSYAVSELSFKSWSNVILQGDTNNIGYSSISNAVKFNCGAGVYGVIFPSTSFGCGIRDISLLSNGYINDSGSVPVIAIAGIEYGIVIQIGSTLLERVGITGFQHACVITNSGNSNIFNQCSFVYNTKTGFSVTNGTAGAFAVYHPNLVLPPAPVSSTTFTMNNCIIRRNGWGIIIRSDAGGTFNNVLIESNYYGGIIAWESATAIFGAETISLQVWNNCYLENNWYNFDPAVSGWYSASVEANNLLKLTASTYIILTENADNALSDLGYQIIIGNPRIGTAYGPESLKFTSFQSSIVDNQKGIYIQQGVECQFINCSMVGGDQSNLCKFSTGAGGYASGTQFTNFNGALPADMGNRGAKFVIDRSFSGGIRADVGGWQGQYFQWASVPFVNTNKNTITHYEYDSFTGTATGLTTTVTGIIKYTRIGNFVSLDVPGFGGVSDATSFTIVGLPTTLIPTGENLSLCFSQDNGGAYITSEIDVKDSGVIQIYYGAGGVFTSSGAKSFRKCTVNYNL